jgi:cyanosortase A-associated protein
MGAIASRSQSGEQLMAKVLNLVYIGLLGSLTVFVLAVMGRSLLDPSWGKLKSISFPENIPLPEWTKTNSSNLSIESDDQYSQKFVGKSYTYTHTSHKPLNLEIFFWNSPSGNMDGFLSTYWQSKKIKYALSMININQQSQSFYGLYYSQNTAHLTSCINPRGNSTVTNQQFQRNIDSYEKTPQQWLAIILGIERLRDWRCLWVNLSIPTSKKDIESDYQTLIAAWENIDSNRSQYFADFVVPARN